MCSCRKRECGVTTRGFLGFLLFAWNTQQQGCGSEEHNSKLSFTGLFVVIVGRILFVYKHIHFPSLTSKKTSLAFLQVNSQNGIYSSQLSQSNKEFCIVPFVYSSDCECLKTSVNIGVGECTVPTPWLLLIILTGERVVKNGLF